MEDYGLKIGDRIKLDYRYAANSGGIHYQVRGKVVGIYEHFINISTKAGYTTSINNYNLRTRAVKLLEVKRA